VPLKFVPTTLYMPPIKLPPTTKLLLPCTSFLAAYEASMQADEGCSSLLNMLHLARRGTSVDNWTDLQTAEQGRLGGRFDLPRFLLDCWAEDVRHLLHRRSRYSWARGVRMALDAVCGVACCSSIPGNNGSANALCSGPICDFHRSFALASLDWNSRLTAMSLMFPVAKRQHASNYMYSHSVGHPGRGRWAGKFEKHASLSLRWSAVYSQEFGGGIMRACRHLSSQRFAGLFAAF
jgi:hypothetical protein